MKFAFKMAWRDFRAKPSRYLLYVLTVAIGTASFYSIESFRAAISNSIRQEGKSLLGADVRLRNIRPFTKDQLALVDKWPGQKASLLSFRTMLTIPGSSKTRLVEVQAFEPAYPFYGEIKSFPESAAVEFHQSASALIDEVLALQLGIEPGQGVVLGGHSYTVSGLIRQTPGDIPARSLIAPRVFVPLESIDKQRMEQPGMMARFEMYFASDGSMPDEQVSRFVDEAKAVGLNAERLEDRQSDLLGDMNRLTGYLGLIGFSGLVVSCLGIIGAIQFFILTKRQTVGYLRCIGTSIVTVSAIFLVQLIFIGAMGAGLGLFAGFGLSKAIPSVLGAFLPVDVTGSFSLNTAAFSFFSGLWFTVLSGILPIIRLRQIPPIYSLRVEALAAKPAFKDWLWVSFFLLLLVSFVLFSIHQLENLTLALVYSLGLFAMMGVLMLAGALLRFSCAKMIRAGWSYPGRLAVSGLYRPQNQTIMMTICMGLGVFMINTIDVLERHVVQDLQSLDQDRPNIAMIDIQPDQKDNLLKLLAEYSPASVYAEPMITMRLNSINGLSIPQLEKQPGNRREEWALKREFRTTYRGKIKPEIETIMAGTWVSKADISQQPVPISLEEGIAKALQVSIGDHLGFDIHGTLIETRVANLRKADWKSMQPNFFIVFPEGVIEDAPQSLLVFCSITNLSGRADFQAKAAALFPNVTAIDISIMMSAASEVTRKLSAGIKSIAWLVLASGLIVMFAILRSGRMVRLREAVLLRTIGASSKTILKYQAYEMLLLAFAATASGLLLSIVASWAAVRFGLKMEFQPGLFSPWIYLAAFMFVVVVSAAWQASQALKMKPAQSWRALAVSSS